MFGARFLAGSLAMEKSSVHITLSEGTSAPQGGAFQWQESEDAEHVVQRFQAFLLQTLRERPAHPAAPPLATALRIIRMSPSAESSDGEIVTQIIALLRRHGLEALSCREAAPYLACAHSVAAMACLARLDLASCALAELPPGLLALTALRALDVSRNKLASLPADIGRLAALESLAADENALTAVPDALSGLSRLTHLSLASNRLKTPLLDLSRLSALQALHLGGNPLTYIPELSHATALRTLSLAAICITADEAYTAIRVTLPKRGMAMNLRAPRCPVPDDLLALLLDRSSCQHPLLAGGLAELSRDVEVRAALLRMDHALPQIVLLACSQQPVVAARACETLRLLAEVADAAARLERASAKDAIHSAVRSPSQPVQLAALQLLQALAVASDDVARRLLTDDTIATLQQLVEYGSADVSCAALVALASLAFPVHNKATLLRHTALLAMLKRAAAPGARSSRLRAAAVRTLAVLGQNDLVDAAVGRPPIAGRGLRVLALDGGGMKGMAEVRMLRAIEVRTGRRIWELFDVIGGTSTGCMLAMGVGIMGMTLDAMEEVYMGLGKRVFSKRAAAAAAGGPEAGGGAARESWAESLARMYRSGEESMRVALYGAKYSAGVFEQLLREASCLTAKGCVEDALIDAAWLRGPKVFGCATESSVSPARPFIFRSYEFPPGAEAAARAARLALHAGSSKHQVWQAIRASSAAPYYLDEFGVGDLRFQDGAVTVNNPAVVAVQEARMLFPSLPIDCVVSLGVGSTPRVTRARGMHSYLEAGAAVVESATSVDRPHEALAAMLDLNGSMYERFNAVDERCAVDLDCTDATVIAGLLAAADDHLAANERRFHRMCALLQSPFSQSAALHTRRLVPQGRLSQRPDVLHIVPSVEPAVGGLRAGGADDRPELPWARAAPFAAHTAHFHIVERAQPPDMRPAAASPESTRTAGFAPPAADAATPAPAQSDDTPAGQHGVDGKALDHLVQDLQAVSASQASCSLDEVAAFRDVPHSTIQRALDLVPEPAMALLGQAASKQTGAAASVASTAQAALAPVGKALTDALPHADHDAAGTSQQQRGAAASDAALPSNSSQVGQPPADASDAADASCTVDGSSPRSDSTPQKDHASATGDELPAHLPSQGSIYDMFMSMVGSTQSPRAQRAQPRAPASEAKHSSAPASPVRAAGALNQRARPADGVSSAHSESPKTTHAQRPPSALHWPVPPSPLASSLGPRSASDVAAVATSGTTMFPPQHPTSGRPTEDASDPPAHEASSTDRTTGYGAAGGGVGAPNAAECVEIVATVEGTQPVQTAADELQPESRDAAEQRGAVDAPASTKACASQPVHDTADANAADCARGPPIAFGSARDGYSAQDACATELAVQPPLREEEHARVGMLLLDLQPSGTGFVASYTHRVFAVAEPSEAATAIARRAVRSRELVTALQESRDERGTPTTLNDAVAVEHLDAVGRSVSGGAEDHEQDVPSLSELFDAVGLLAADDGSGVVWRKAFCSSQSLFTSNSAQDAVTITTLVLHEWTPARTISDAELGQGGDVFAGRVVASPFAVGAILASALCKAGAAAVACAKRGAVAADGCHGRSGTMQALQASWQAMQGGCSISDAVLLHEDVLELHEE